MSKIFYDRAGAEISPDQPDEQPGEEIEVAQEKSPAEIEEEHYQELQAILNMFGTREAEKNFRDLLDAYREVYLQDKVRHDLQGQGLGVHMKAEFGRSGIHNEIMDALQRLSMHAEPGSREEAALRNMANRRATHQYIADYMAVRDRRAGREKKYHSPFSDFR